MSMLPRREFCMKQEASIVRNVIYIHSIIILYIFHTYCMIIVAVQQIYKHYLSIIFMCYWFIHKEDGFYFPKHLHFSL